MILVDASIPMYLLGADHPNKVTAQRLLERSASRRERLVTDAEVFQEILHRYVAIDRRDAIQPAFDLLRAIAEEVFLVDGNAVERAKELVLRYRHLPARDAIHIATMQAHDVSRIMSFDTGFDVVPGIERLSG